MNDYVRAMVPDVHFGVLELASGVSVRRLHPGGMVGPNGEVNNEISGGQTWSEMVALGTESDDFIMALPDIRLPANQLWPMHWHDCWTVVVILEGTCQIADWYMTVDDVFVAAPSIEYGPLLIGPKGCRMLEVFGDLALSPGGYGPEYRDHPTLSMGAHVFKPREGVNTRNQGKSSLPLDGVDGMWKSRLSPGWSWDLGSPGDPKRGIMRNTCLAAGETLPGGSGGDWYAGLVLDGVVEVGGQTLVRDDVLVIERGGKAPPAVAGPEGARVLEHYRTTLAL